jgi:hypothetical protein
MKLASGDTFKIKINKGFGVLQYFETMDDWISRNGSSSKESY